ncbi:hypothetical protein BS78_K216900 [Paspalum vaginatum]|uniref:Uncharacterized protein n=1 Tax=Paspalum vaginatum TaxID=158149 RepID=A0A9W8CDD4_9POAL|nr:hypothetical protein BS78_K216900 [Paspalum vaginatum]
MRSTARCLKAEPEKGNELLELRSCFSCIFSKLVQVTTIQDFLGDAQADCLYG